MLLAGENNRGRGRLLGVGDVLVIGGGTQLTVNQAFGVIVTSPHVRLGVCWSCGGEGASPLTANPGGALGTLFVCRRRSVGTLAGGWRVVPRPVRVRAGLGTFCYFAILLISSRQRARRRQSVQSGGSQQRRGSISSVPQRTDEHGCYCIKSHFPQLQRGAQNCCRCKLAWQMKTCPDVLSLTTPVFLK